MLRGHFIGALVSITLFVPPANGVTNASPTHMGQLPSDLLTVEQGARLEHAPPLKPRPVSARASRRLAGPPYLLRLLIGSWGAARALSDRSAAWAGRVLHSHLPS